MVNINNVAIFITVFTYDKNQLHFDYVLIKMHPTTGQDMGNKLMMVQGFREQHLVPLTPLKLHINHFICFEKYNVAKYNYNIYLLFFHCKRIYAPAMQICTAHNFRR